MNSLCHLILLASILANVVGGIDFQTVNVTCAYNDDNRESCTITDVDYQNESPSILNILNADASKDTFHLKMFNGFYTVMPLNLFQLLPKLESLEISTGLKAITRENLSGGSKLKQLNLSYNTIRAVKAHTFHGMDKLEVIDLDTNKLTKVESNAFAGAINLKKLVLSWNEIDTIEDGAFDIPTLEEIKLTFNMLRTLTDDLFVGCPELKRVYLYGNELTRIGKSIDNVPKLTEVSFGTYDVKIIDFDFYAIARRSTLEEYCCDDMQLSLDNSASAANDNYTVKRLHISGNRLSYPDILHRLRNFRNLTLLNVSNNNFTTIDDIDNILEMFPKLEELDVHKLPCEDKVIQRLQTKFGDKIKLVSNQNFVLN